MDERTKRIAELNDQLRTTFNPKAGKVLLTQGFQSLGDGDQVTFFGLVRTFNDFTVDNDPYGEHDFGAVEHNGNKVFFKIDYYAPDLQHGSEDPADPNQTVRVMTLMLSHEY